LIENAAAEATARSLLLRAASTFALATGLRCAATDREGRPLAGGADPGAAAPLCSLCAALGAAGPFPGCADYLRYGLSQAERFGGCYVYLCPSSLFFLSAVVRLDAASAGSLAAGPALLVDREEILAETRPCAEGAAAFAAALDALPALEPRRAKALADILAALAAAAGGELEGRADPEAVAAFDEARASERLREIRAAWGSEEGAGLRGARGYPFHKERELLAMVASGDGSGARGLLNEILGSVFFEGSGELEEVRARALEIAALLSRAAFEGGALPEELFGASEDFMRRVSSSGSVDEIAARLAGVLGRFADSVMPLGGARHAQALRRARRAIRERLAEDLRLEDAAREAGLSPSYFSAVFKAETGEGFAACLAAARVARAKELLKEPSIPLVEVAGMVGFHDQSYFGRVFKSLVGMTPGRYREGRPSPEEGIELHGPGPSPGGGAGAASTTRSRS
jgi:two-component system response regulator YesN